MVNLQKIGDYFRNKFEKFGPTPQGEDWNSVESQEIRFKQLSKVINGAERYSIIDYGCGYGAFYEYLYHMGHHFSYQGYDIVKEVIKSAQELHSKDADCEFTFFENSLKPADYVVESGIFNIKMDATESDWTTHVIKTLERLNYLSIKGMAFNFLTKYSDPEYMRPDLYYPDPCFYFDYCKKNFSKNVALLHDYQLYDFTIIVRK